MSNNSASGSSVVDLTGDEDLLVDLSWLRRSGGPQSGPQTGQVQAQHGTAGTAQQLYPIHGALPLGSQVKQDPVLQATPAHAASLNPIQAQALAQAAAQASAAAAASAAASSASRPASSSSVADNSALADQPHSRHQVSLLLQ